MVDDEDLFGFDSGPLAKWISSLGVPYEPFAEAVLTKGLFGSFLVDRVDSVEKFAETLSKIGVTEVSLVVNFHSSFL